MARKAKGTKGRKLVARGVRTHNLKNIRFTVPVGKLTVVTGVSGSGKSSLALDTLFAEGERRYVESLSAYARQFLSKLARPDVDFIGHIPPAIAIRHSNDVKNARSTVGTATEIHDYLRLIFARIGETACPQCGGRVTRVSPAEARDHIARRFAEDERIMLVAPVEKGADETIGELVARLRARGALRAVVGDRVVRLDEAETGELATRGVLSVVVDRIRRGNTTGERIAEGVANAYRLAGRAVALGEKGGRLHLSERFACLDCARESAEPDPLLFSFNSPRGACPACEGFGRIATVDVDRVIPDKNLSLAEGAVRIWQSPAYRDWLPYLRRFAERNRIPWRRPYKLLTAKQKRIIEEGDDEFPGIRGFFEYLKRKRYKVHVRVFIAKHRKFETCPACGGARLVPEALAVRLGGAHIAELAAWPIPRLRAFLERLELSPAQRAIAGDAIGDVVSRVRFLERVGLSYITLSRQMRTLSAGEAQRIRLAAALGSALSGVLYILDEPTVGLHARDTGRLIDILRRLVAKANTVVAIEHDVHLIRASDHVIDLGPGGGEHGGRVLYQGPPEKLAGRKTPTGRALVDTRRAAPRRRRPSARRWLTIRGARTHNLKNVTVRIPLNRFICITGVSGSGKSSLITDTLWAAYRRGLGDYSFDPPRLRALEGADSLDEIVLVDPKPLAKSRRSNIVTQMGAYGHIRGLLAASSGLKPGDFSFNVPGGRCERCGGMGKLEVDMVFMASVMTVCETCRGKRFKENVLKVRYRGKNVLEILDMTATEALRFFADTPAVTRALAPLEAIGLGYIRLGQSTDTLSGGEAARLKLATFLKAKKRKGDVLFLFDEPTTGLHPADVEVFASVIESLIAHGHTAVVIEHNLALLARADYIVDLGPEGGPLGGRIVGRGAPETIARKDTPTGRALAAFFAGKRQPPTK